MNKGKTGTIEEVSYHSRGYYLGLDYLAKNHPDNLHLISCYKGVSFRNLARCIMFDRSKRVLKLDRYLRRPRRFVLFSTSGKITGVMVTASLPEFYHEIEYEDYVVIGTETAPDYDKFLSSLSFDGKAEIVTFDAEQARLVRSRFFIRKTHCWSVFAYPGKTLAGDFTNIRTMDAGDSDVAKRLAKRLPEESSPFRSLQFQLKGLLYKNYVLSPNGTTSVFIGLCPFSTGVYQINYLVGSSVDNAFLLVAIGAVAKLVKASGCELIWRLRRKDVLRSKSLIKRSGFVEVVKENHLHLGKTK